MTIYDLKLRTAGDFIPHAGIDLNQPENLKNDKQTKDSFALQGSLAQAKVEKTQQKQASLVSHFVGHSPSCSQLSASPPVTSSLS